MKMLFIFAIVNKLNLQNKIFDKDKNNIDEQKGCRIRNIMLSTRTP